MLRRSDYVELVVEIFAHQIKIACYGGNVYVYIEEIDLEHFSNTDQVTLIFNTHSCTRHAVFHSFLSDNSKQYVAQKYAHRKQIIDLLKTKIFR